MLKVSLLDYGRSLSESFEVFVDDCVIVELNVIQPTTTEFVYDVLPDVATLVIPRLQATVKPAQCGFHGVLYTYEFFDLPDFPSFATPLPNGLQVQTTKSSDAGTYTF